MAMTAAVKDELSRLSVTQVSCRRAEVSALLRFAGGLHIVAGRVVVEAEVDMGNVARRLRREIHDLYGYASDVHVLRGGGLRKSARYIVRITKDGEGLARQTGLLDLRGRPVRGLPFAENPDSHSEAWVQDVPPRPLDFASLTAICDSFLPRIFLRRKEFTPIGTVSMNIYFHAGAEELARHGDAPLLTVADGQAFSDGHFDHNGLVWSKDGELLASTHQLVWYKE